jgi:hypothetical protein
VCAGAGDSVSLVSVIGGAPWSKKRIGRLKK